MELIDKSAVVAEIERLITELVEEGEDTMFEQGRISAFEDVKVFINHTLEVKEDVVSNDPLISTELLTASAAYARGQLANPDYPTYNDEYELLCAFEAGAKWQEEQMEKNRIEHCHSITEEQYNLETSFVDSHIKKYHRIPTILDAIEYGMSLKKGE